MTLPTERRAVALMLAAMACLILLDTSGKWLAMRDVPIAATTWSRYVGHLAVVLALYLPTCGTAIFRSGRVSRQVLRGLLTVAVTLLYFAALRSMPLAQATAVFFTTPMLVTLFATLFLRERPGWRAWAAVAGGFAGVLVVIRPGADLPLAGTLLVLAAAAANAGYYVLTRAQARVDSPQVQVLYSGLVAGTVMTLALPLWWTPGWWRMDGLDGLGWLVFAMVGVLGAAGQLLVAHAYRLAQASRLSAWTYTQMVLSVALGWLVFGDAPDAIALAGMVLIAASPQLARLPGPGATRPAP
jgi:drug/metabolite transporter (DMT)-like permease